MQNTDMKQVLDAIETVLMSFTWAERRKVLEDSIALYEARGFKELAAALRERLAQDARADDGAPPTNLAVARMERAAPDTMAAFEVVVSFENSPGCNNPTCRSFVLGVEVGQLNARLDARPAEWIGTYHADNSTMIERVAAGKRYSVTFERSADPAWVFATFAPLPEPARLSIVPAPAKAP